MVLYLQQCTALCASRCQATTACLQAADCLATMRARGRKQGGRGRDNDLAAMCPTSAQAVTEHRGCSVCEMTWDELSAMTFFEFQPC